MMTALTITKNSAHMIKSFIHYNANVADNFIIMLTNPSGRTPAIVNQPKEERNHFVYGNKGPPFSI